MADSNTKKKILNAAIQLFNEFGLANVRLQQIAKEIGISVGNLAYHFRNKEAMIAVISEELDREFQEMLSSDSKLESLLDLDHKLATYFSFLQKYPFYFQDLLEMQRHFPEMGSKRQAHFEKMTRQIRGHFQFQQERGLIKEEFRPGLYDKLSQSIWVLITFWLSQNAAQPKGKATDERLFKTMIWDQFHPYLTEAGLEQFDRLIAPLIKESPKEELPALTANEHRTTNLIWLQGGACGGNTMSFLNAEQPSVIELVTDFGIQILYHPSISLEMGLQVTELLDDVISGRTPLDVLVFEGSVVNGPNGTGTMNLFADHPMKYWLDQLAKVAGYIVAIGDCAAWGGIVAVPPNPTESTGMQFHKKEKGGYFGADFLTRNKMPVINIAGCPAHPDWITQILVAIATGRAEEVNLDEFNRPRTFFSDTVQAGCPNVSSFVKKVKGTFGKRGGCLFYEVGCRGPMTHASCNQILWNRVSSKTRVNHPCLGCTEPGFPHQDLKKGSFFKVLRHSSFSPKEVLDKPNKMMYYLKSEN